MRPPNTLLKISLVLLIGCWLCGVVGCATDKQVISQADQMHASLKPAVMSDPQLADYLQKVGDRIIDAAKELDRQGYDPGGHSKESNAWMFSNSMKFHFVNSQTMNAFTTGGDHMYIYNALFQQCQSEDELAAVMCHEYAHVYCRHVAKGMNTSMATLIAGTAVGAAAGYAVGGENNKLEAAGTGASLGAAGGQFVNMGFTRKDEAQADQVGFNFYCHAGWAPDHFADFFKHMIAMGYDKTPGVLSDHPTLASRVEEANRRVKELPASAKNWRRPPIADAQAFAALKARAAQLAKTMPDDKSLAQAQTILSSFASCVTPADQPGQEQARATLAEQIKRLQAKQKQ